MALPNAVKGARRPSLTMTWYREDTTTPEDLTSATITGNIRRGLRSSSTVEAITGTLTVVDGSAGTFRWDFSAADVDESGDFEVQFSAAFGAGQTPAKTFVTRWTVEESLA